MEIKVLGPGCAKCKATYRVVEKVVSDNKIDAHLVKVEDIVVVVDGVVKIKGYVPSEAEVRKALGI